jgi:hypothetical protein
MANKVQLPAFCSVLSHPTIWQRPDMNHATYCYRCGHSLHYSNDGRVKRLISGTVCLDVSSLASQRSRRFTGDKHVKTAPVTRQEHEPCGIVSTHKTLTRGYLGRTRSRATWHGGGDDPSLKAPSVRILCYVKRLLAFLFRFF